MFKILLANSYLIFGLLFTIKNYAQSPIANKDVLVTFSPLALADIFDGASVRMGLETNINQRTALAVDGGYYLSYLKATKINPKGFLIRPSVKYYLDAKKGKGKFLALEYQYKNQRYNFIDSIAINENRFEKEYGMKRIIHSVVVKYGKLIALGKEFTLEWYCGIGIKHIRSHSTLTAEEEDSLITGEEGDCPIQEEFIRLTGTRIFPDFRGGVKIGLAL